MLLRALALVAAVSTAAEARKYNTTSKRLRGVINLHLVPHTHDDVGWLKTVDEYYYGNQNQIQRAVVQNILNSMIKELAWNPDRKFIYVEQAFFQRFWEEADEQKQGLIRGLVASGQLEFVNGGWCMHDEANPTFVDMIDQTTLGHRLLLQQFNVTPKVTWQIDPFGHSTFQAAMMSSPISGYNGVYFARSDYADVQNRNNQRTSEYIWAPSTTLGMNGATYAGILYGGYCTIGGIGMDVGSNDSPIMDDTTLEDYNVGAVIEGVVNAVMDDFNKYPQGGTDADGTVDVMLPLGCDFNYENSATWFTNTDKLIHYLNQDGRVNAFYSTPSIYTTAKLEAGKSYTVNTADLFPYGDGEHSIWSGYFVSRSALKGYIRDTSSVFQAAKQIQAFNGGAQDTSSSNPLFRLERALGVTQHHDAVAGTAKTHVSYDYARRLAWGRQDADSYITTAFSKFTGYTTTYASCDLSNATICPALEGGVSTFLTIWGQQAQGSSASNILLPIGVPSGVASYAVYDATGNAVTAQLLPLSGRDLSLRQGYYLYNATVPMQWLAFQAKLPPAGYSIYFVVPTASVEDAPLTHISIPQVMRIGSSRLRTSSSSKGKKNGAKIVELEGDQTISNGITTITIDGSSGLVNKYASTANGMTVPLGQNFYWYNASVGNHDDGQASGAYIFRPNSSAVFEVAGDTISVTLVTGPIINEARQVFASWATQSVRLWAGASTIDFEMTIGPIPFSDGLGKEIITKYTTDFSTNGTWYTDSNGRDSNKRMYNYRPTWNYTVYEPVAGNYYPVNAFITTQDITSGQTISVMTDRSQGGSSLADGELEVMVQRRLQHDDGRGVGEPLNETGLDLSGDGLIVRTLHRVSLDANAATAGVSRRTAVADLLYKPLTRVSQMPVATTPAQFIAKYKSSYTGLQSALPANVHLLTVHSWSPTQLLIRLSHSYEANEGGAMSNNVTVNLANLFTSITLTSCTETTLTANQPLAKAPQITYNVTNGPVVTLPVVPAAPSGAGMSVTLAPMEIRTFLCIPAPAAAE